MNDLSRLFIIFGVCLIVVGIGIQVVGKIPGFGKLPGDIYIKKENVTFYFPIVTSLIVSIVLSLLVSIFWRK